MVIFLYIFLSLIIASGIVIADYFLPGNFLSEFLNSGFIETFSVLVGLNLTAVIFLLGQLLCLEEKFENPAAFMNTRREIKQNSFFLFSAFCLSLVLLVFRPNLNENNIFSENIIFYLITGSIIALFILAMVTIIEILRSVFILSIYNKRS